MKQKLLFGLCMAAIAVNILAGCSKDERVVKLGIRTEGVGGAKVTLSDANSPQWQNDDEIYLNNTTRAVSVDDNSASIDGIDGVTVYRAVYPATIVVPNSDISANATVPVRLPAEQSYKREGGKQIIDIPMGAFLSSGYTLNFKNLCSLVKVTLPNQQGVDLTMESITLQALNNGVKLSGDGQATIDGSSNCGVVMGSTNTSDNVILSFPNTAPVTISNGSSQSFYIVVPPFSDFTKIKFTILATDGTYNYTLVKEMPSGVMLERNNIATITISLFDMTSTRIYRQPIGTFTTNTTTGAKVGFAPGNLQVTWTGSDTTWSFTSHQYDYPEGKYQGYFSWSESANAHWGLSTSTTSADFSGTFKDWGDNPKLIENLGENWRTLTADEWKVIINDRTTSVTFNDQSATNARYMIVKVGGNPGIVLFPDEATIDAAYPAGDVNVHKDFKTTALREYTANEWSVFQNAGCVFLPLRYYRSGANLYSNTYAGHYWTATPGIGRNDYAQYCGTSGSGIASYYRYIGLYVRLVKNR